MGIQLTMPASLIIYAIVAVIMENMYAKSKKKKDEKTKVDKELNKGDKRQGGSVTWE